MNDPGSSKKAVARAHANIALAKYWGKRDSRLNIPATPSLSAGLATLWVEATVEFEEGLSADHLEIDGTPVGGDPLARVSHFLDHVRSGVGGGVGGAWVVTRGNFPRDAGLASSAAAFAALAMAACDALGLELTPYQLSALARRGSASAARSVFEGYVEFPVGGHDPHAIPLLPAADFPLEVVVALCDSGHKPMSSRQAMELAAETSPYYASWVQTAEADTAAIREALLEGRFDRLATAAEHNCLKMHATSLTSRPPVVFWSAGTMAVIRQVAHLRAQGLKVFFTIDAGPNVVIFCKPGHRGPVVDLLADIPVEVLLTKVGGAVWRSSPPP